MVGGVLLGIGVGSDFGGDLDVDETGSGKHTDTVRGGPATFSPYEWPSWKKTTDSLETLQEPLR